MSSEITHLPKHRLYFVSEKSVKKLHPGCDLFIASAGYVSTSAWTWVTYKTRLLVRQQVGTLRRVIEPPQLGITNAFTLVEVETVPEWEERQLPLDIEWLGTSDGSYKPPRGQMAPAVAVWAWWSAKADGELLP